LAARQKKQLLAGLKEPLPKLFFWLFLFFYFFKTSAVAFLPCRWFLFSFSTLPKKQLLAGQKKTTIGRAKKTTIGRAKEPLPKLFF
jgi:hypothetical protein